MERYYKIIGIFIFSTIALYSNAWAYVIGFAFLTQIFNIWEKGKYVMILVPLTFTLIASVGEAYTWMSLGIFATYIVRCLFADNCYNSTRIWVLFSLMFIGTIIYTPYLMILPLVLLCVTIPTINISLSTSKINIYFQ